MRAFLAGTAAAIVVSVIAALILGNLDWTVADVYQSSHGSVRL